MKKIIFISILFFLSGCASEQDKKTVITFAGGGVGVEEQVTREQIIQFQKENPDIEVKYKVMPDSSTQRHDIFVTHLSASDTSIDVYMIDIIWPAEFAAAGWILPLDKYVDENKLADFFNSTIQGCSYNGKLYALPFFVTVGLLYYRKDLLQEGKFSPPKTWKQLVEQAQVLSENKESMDGFLWQAAQYEGLVCNFLEFLWSNGGEVINNEGEIVIDSPQAIEALELMIDTIYKYRISPMGTTNYKEEDTRQIFQSGRGVFLRNWPYVWTLVQSEESQVKGKIGVAPLPHGPKGERGVSCIGGWNLAISSYSKHPKEAYKFIEFMTRPRQQIYRAIKAGQSPTIKKTYKNKRLLKANPFYKNLYDAIIDSRARLQSPFYSDISEIIQIQVSKALSRQVSAAQALKETKKQIEQILEKFKNEQ